MPFRLSRRQIISGMASLGVWRAAVARDAFGQAPKRIIVPEGDFAAVPIAIPNFVAGTPADGEVGVGVDPGHHQQSQAQRTVRADRSGRLYRKHHQYRRRAAIPELEDHQRAGAGDRPHDPAGRRTAEGGISPLGCHHRPAACRPAIFHLAGILAADRAHHFRPDLRAPDRRERLFRQPRGVRRRNRIRGTARQAAGADGPGRRQCSLPDARRRPGADAAVLAVDPGNHLYGIRPGRSAGLSVQYRNRAARDRRQLSRACRSRRGSRRTASA